METGVTKALGHGAVAGRVASALPTYSARPAGDARTRLRASADATASSPAAAAAAEVAAASAHCCQVCLERAVEVVLLPCSHVPVCRQCAAHPSMTRCPVCRKPIRTSFRVYL